MAQVAGSAEQAVARLEAAAQVLVYQSFPRFVPVQILASAGDLLRTPYRPDVIHRVVTYQRASWRAGTAKTKDRAEVSGSGRKPWPQKGQGRARAGSLRAPQFRGGGRVHSPTPERIWRQELPRKIRLLGLASALSKRNDEGRLWVLERWWMDDGTRIGDDQAVVPNTSMADAQQLSRILNRLQWKAAVLVSASQPVPAATAAAHPDALSDSDWIEDVQRVERAAMHVRHEVSVKSARSLGVYEVVRHQHVVITRAALHELEARVAPQAGRRGEEPEECEEQNP